MGRELPDLVRVLESAYQMDLSQALWLRGLVDAIRPAADDGLGMAAYVYDITKRPFQVQDLMHDTAVDDAGLAFLLDSSHDEYVRRSWLTPSVATASETPGYSSHPGVHQVFHPAGIQDFMVINALDPTGIGCWIGAPMRDVKQLDERDRQRWGRVASHVRAALRLRLRLTAHSNASTEVADTSGASEAVLTPDGQIAHLTPVAEPAREALREAVLAIERARGALRGDPERALPSWKALVQARWTLVDDFQADGTRFLLARANGHFSAGLELLTPRERQVVACAAMGQTNKETAYELGLSHSTVRVLLRRACGKLGVKTRVQLIASYRNAASDEK